MTVLRILVSCLSLASTLFMAPAIRKQFARALLSYSTRAKHVFMIEKYYFFFWDLRLALCWRYFAF